MEMPVCVSDAAVAKKEDKEHYAPKTTQPPPQQSGDGEESEGGRGRGGEEEEEEDKREKQRGGSTCVHTRTQRERHRNGDQQREECHMNRSMYMCACVRVHMRVRGARQFLTTHICAWTVTRSRCMTPPKKTAKEPRKKKRMRRDTHGLRHAENVRPNQEKQRKKADRGRESWESGGIQPFSTARTTHNLQSARSRSAFSLVPVSM